MRILAIGNRYPPWSTGGYEITWAEAVRALRAAGHQVSILTTLADPSDVTIRSPDPDVHRDLRWYWREHRFPRIGISDCISLERANAAVLRHHLAAFSPDAVMWWAMGGMSLSLLEQVRRAGVPAVGAVGDDWIVYGPRVDAWTRLWQGKRRLLAPIADRCVGVPAGLDLDRDARWTFNSQYTLNTARGTGWRLPGAVVAHPGVDLELFPYREPGQWRWRLLYCGRVDPRKGIATAVEALARLPVRATLTIHGDGNDSHRDELQSLAASLGVADRLRFRSTEHCEVPAAYAAADALVFPVTWREPWGLVPLESMASGRPVVASRGGGGAAEYLRDGRNCLQFPPGDPHALAGALGRLAGDAELRAKLVAGGRETAAAFSDRKFHDALESELERAVSAA